MDAQDYGIAPSLRFGIGTPTQVTLSALVQHNRDMPDYGLPFISGKPAPVSSRNFYGLTDDRTLQDVQVYTADVEHKVSPTLTVRNQTRYGRYDIDAMPSAFSVNAASAGTPLALRTVTLSRKNRLIDDDSLYNQTDLVKKFATGSVRHTLLAGIEIGRDNYRNRGYTWTGLPTNVSLVTPVYQATPAGAVQTLNATRTETRADTLAVYVNDTAELTRQWKVVAGLRRDRFAAEQETITNATGAVSKLDQTVYATSARSGLIYQPTEVQSYYLSYGTSFNPSAETLAVSTTAPNIASVAPEKNRSFELGAKWDLYGGDLSLASALFRIEKTNARSTDPITGFVNLDGDVRVDGFEISAAGRITPKWQVMAAYTFLDGQIVKSLGLQSGLPTQGNAPANTPRESASLWTAYQVAPDWEVGGGVLHVGSRYVTNANNTVVDGYNRFDATVAYHQPRYDVRLNLLNLTDAEYFESIIGSDGGRAAPGRRRTALLTLTYKF